MAATDLYAVAEDLLEQVVVALEAESRDVPEHRYVAEGNVAVDCAQQLTVSMVETRFGSPGVGAPDHIVRGCPPFGRTATFDVHLTRCAATLPDGAAPTAESIDTSAQGVLGDAYAVMIGLVAQFQAGTWLDICDSINVGPLTRFGPEGGAVGFTLTVEVGL